MGKILALVGKKKNVVCKNFMEKPGIEKHHKYYVCDCVIMMQLLEQRKITSKTKKERQKDAGTEASADINHTAAMRSRNRTPSESQKVGLLLPRNFKKEFPFK